MTTQTPEEKIEAIDEVLKTFTQAFEDAKEERKDFWRKKIDNLLDDRLTQMKERDSTK